MRTTVSRIPGRISLVVACAVSVGGSWSGPGARAEIAPGQYEQLKRDAPEVLGIVVRKVKKLRQEEFRVTLEVEADVRSVERSKQGLKPGASLTFRSYYVPPEAFQRGFTGPQSPPRLEPGWSGTAYLSDEASPGTLGPAAYGQSFEKKRLR